MLLHEINGPTSFVDLKTVNNVLHPTFQSACLPLGLLEDDKHWDNALEEAALSDQPVKLRDLFTLMLVFCQLSNALIFWKKTETEDIKRLMEIELHGEKFHNMNEAYNKCLILIHDAVISIGGQGLA